MARTSRATFEASDHLVGSYGIQANIPSHVIQIPERRRTSRDRLDVGVWVKPSKNWSAAATQPSAAEHGGEASARRGDDNADRKVLRRGHGAGGDTSTVARCGPDNGRRCRRRRDCGRHNDREEQMIRPTCWDADSNGPMRRRLRRCRVNSVTRHCRRCGHRRRHPRVLDAVNSTRRCRAPRGFVLEVTRPQLPCGCEEAADATPAKPV